MCAGAHARGSVHSPELASSRAQAGRPRGRSTGRAREHAAVDLVRRLDDLGGAARRSDFVGAAGWRALRDAVAAGEIVDHGGGCYALPGAPVWAVRATQFRGVLTCVSWAEVHGLAVVERAPRVHLAVSRDRSVRSSPSRSVRSVVLHRVGWASTRARPDPPVASAVEAVSAVLRCLPALEAVATVDSALNRGLCAADEVRRGLVGPGSVRARWVLDQCDPRSESLLESMARVGLRAAGLAVEVNVPVPGVGRVDLLVEGVVVVELDGYEFHASREAFGRDRRRDRALQALGLRVLRFTYAEAFRNPEVVVTAVRAVLGADRRSRA